MTSIKTKYPTWFNHQTIYEVNLRQYTRSGTIKEFAEHLPRLKELGVGILWLMPVQPIGKKNRKGTLGSYYSISNYSAINPEFGSLEDFNSLVKKIHDLGMKVIIDWVANHTAWDHHWTKDHPEFYSRDENGNFKPPYPDWEDVIHLNYNNPALWEEMIGQMAFWIRETDVDGFRCDMAHLVPTIFWNHARFQLEKIKPLFMLAESENHDLLEYAFDVIYNWKLLHTLNDVAAGKITGRELLISFKEGIDHLPLGALQLNFTTNHDENSWQGSAIERLHYYLEPLTVLSFLLPGVPLIYSGQEAGNYRRLKFFDKDEIEWKEDKMNTLYKQLCTLKKNFSMMATGSNTKIFHILNTSEPEKVAAFELNNMNGRLIVVCNLSDQLLSARISLNVAPEPLQDYFSGETFPYSQEGVITIKPFGYYALTGRT